METGRASAGGLEYHDLDLEIGAATGSGAPDTYPVAIRSRAGEARGVLRLPSAAGELVRQHGLPVQALTPPALVPDRAARAELDPTRHLRPTGGAPEPLSAQTSGKALFEALFTGRLIERLAVSRDLADREGAGLRVRLRIQPPELAVLPWELLFDPDQDEHLCLARNTALVRYLELPQPIQPLTVIPPLRVLGMAARPSDADALDVAAEIRWTEDALKGLVAEGVVQLTWLQGQTWRALREAMLSGEWHIFHFIGHGGFSRERNEGEIVLAGDAGLASPLGATQLARLLGYCRPLRLVLLNACDGARAVPSSAFASTAATLVRRQVPAVVAMQYPISDRAAIEFARTFYDALARGMAVDTAVAAARVAISIELPGTAEWATPALFMRAPDGVLFRPPAPPPAAAAARSPLGSNEQALQALRSAGPGSSTNLSPIQEQSRSVRRSLDALLDLVQVPEVRADVVRFRTYFQMACEQIDIMGDYKDLHDKLHELQVYCFNAIVQEARRFPSEEAARDNLGAHLDSYERIVAELQDIVARQTFARSDRQWMNELVKARDQLREALENGDPKRLREALGRMNRVLAREPVKINVSLRAAASVLPLSDLEHAMRSIASRLPAPDLDAQKVDQFQAGIEDLDRLSGNLQVHVYEHDRWQSIDDTLRAMEADVARDPPEPELLWPDVKAIGDELYGASGEPWAMDMRSRGDRLDAAIAAQDSWRIRDAFRGYHSQEVARFFRVDKTLKSDCDALRRVGEPLAAVLRFIE
jgi:hypothetical protein